MKAHPLNLDAYRAALISKAAECRHELIDARKDLRVETTADNMERRLSAAEREQAAGRSEDCWRLLRQVETALSRMKVGLYGVCLKCQKPIGQKRLDALPWALFCAHCMQTVELLHSGAKALRNEIGRAA
jgi:DnaK suppressor protein